MNASELEKAIAAAQAGQEEGYRRLFSEFSGMAYAVVSRMVGDAGEAEELTQDAFIQAFGSLSEFRTQGAGFSAWLRRIAYNTAVSHLRKRRLPIVAMEETEISVPEESIESAEENIDYLMQAIDRLPEEEKVLFQLFYFDDLSLQEIAYITSSSAVNVGMKLMRIRKKLKKQIASEHRYEER